MSGPPNLQPKVGRDFARFLPAGGFPQPAKEGSCLEQIRTEIFRFVKSNFDVCIINDKMMTRAAPICFQKNAKKQVGGSAWPPAPRFVPRAAREKASVWNRLNRNRRITATPSRNECFPRFRPRGSHADPFEPISEKLLQSPQQAGYFGFLVSCNSLRLSTLGHLISINMI